MCMSFKLWEDGGVWLFFNSGFSLGLLAAVD